MPLSDNIWVDAADPSKANIRAYLAAQERISVKDPSFAESSPGALDGGAVGDGITDDRAAVAAADTEAAGAKGILVPSGTYLINSDLTITSGASFLPGARIKPASGVTVTLSKIPDAGFAEIFDLSAGGTVSISARGPVKVDWWGGKTSAAFSACATGATAKSDVYFEPSTVYTWSAAVTSTNSLSLIGQRAVIGASSILEQAIVFDTVSDPYVENLIYEGAEDIDTFRDDVPGHHTDIYSFLRFDGCTDPRTRRIRASGTRCAVAANACVGTDIEAVVMQGFMPDVSGGMEPGSNFCPAVWVNGGSDWRVVGIDARDHGAILLTGGEATRGVSYGHKGRNVHDEGEYHSSGSKSVSALSLVHKSGGAAVKARGTERMVLGHVGHDVVTGIALTGNGTTPDSEGANGHSLAAVANVISAYSADGVQVGPQDGLSPRDAMVALNLLADGSNTGGFASVRANAVSGLVVALNASVNDGGTTAAFVISGLSGDPGLDFVLLGNLVRGAAGQGLRMQYVDYPIVIGNQMGNVTASQGIDLRNTNHALVVANNATGKIIAASGGNGNADAVVGANKGTVGSTGGVAFDNNA